jgi:polyisoprenoid-binding protein YceI
MTTAIAANPATAPSTTTWNIDAAHTDVLFAAKHMMVTTVRGKFSDVEGSLTLDEANPTRSSAEIRIAAASLNTGAVQRDAHLRSADFFDVENYPAIVFTSTAIEHVAGDDYRILGALTIRETTRPITFDATFLGFYAGMNAGRRAGLSARTKINRKDWGLGWNVALEAGGWLVGEEVTIEIEIAVEQAA